MYRSGWASKEDQEVILAIRLWREYFDDLLAQSVSTAYSSTAEHATVAEWGKALKKSDVLIQWDPDHHIITGAPLPYRVVQLGIRREALEGFRGGGIASITDISQEARRLRKQLLSKPLTDPLSCTEETPLETQYRTSAAIAQNKMIQ
ncbi:hypothetical protein FGB62_76g090 [Gracilaria domingensis]|nr:hypothetical protein FGB62_76g090 [Gracilaria domingensis]